MRINATPSGSMQHYTRIGRRLLLSAIAAWAVLVATELVLLFGALRLFALLLGSELLPSLKVVLDMAALAACGWTAGRVGRPHVMAASAVTAVGLALLDLTPYVPLNVPWLLRLTGNAFGDSRYVTSLVTTLTMHAFMFGSLFAGAHLSRPREAPMRLGFGP